MSDLIKSLQVLIDHDDREQAVDLVLQALATNQIGVVELYTEVLTPLLNGLTCDLEDRKICIWNEHVKTAIIRTIVECCYPYVVKQRRELKRPEKGTVAVVCPPEEYHDLGARMVTDLFTIAGYKAIFVGSGTPYQDFFNAIHAIRPCMVAISVSNYYNLVAAKRMIEAIKSKVDYPLMIVVGGSAFADDGIDKAKVIGADRLLSDPQAIVDFLDCEGAV